MSLVKNLFYEFSSVFSTSFLQKVSPVRTLFPYHHTVSNESLEHIVHLYQYKNVKQFEDDLDALLKYNSPINPADIAKHIRSNVPLPEKTFLLTFDDGFREAHDVIAPILKRKGVPAIFFITPDFLDNKELFYRCKISLLIGQLEKQKVNATTLKKWSQLLETNTTEARELITQLKKINQYSAQLLEELATTINYSFDQYLQTQLPFLTTSQVQALDSDGFTIGAHSMSHYYYQLLSKEMQLEQTIDSVNYVNALLGNEDACFSFPHSDAHLSVALMEELGNTNIPLLFGIQNQQQEDNHRVLHRFNAERPGLDMEKQMKGIYFMLWMKHLAGTDKVRR
jgi:peptidoglycan/xylan/chitin deacetylase (PgdA/CDA1 family)